MKDRDAGRAIGAAIGLPSMCRRPALPRTVAGIWTILWFPAVRAAPMLACGLTAGSGGAVGQYPDDEELWLNVAANATGAQLARICRACRRVLDLDTPKHAEDQLSRRGFWAHFETTDAGIAHRARWC